MPANDTSYAYAVGRVRALENHLLDQNRLERMVDARSAKEALSMLAETRYAPAVAALSDLYDFETMLADELSGTFAFLKEIAPDRLLIELLARRYDLHNLKVLFKAHYLRLEEPESVIPVGAIALEKLKAAIEEENFRELPGGLREGSEEVTLAFALRQDPQEIDLILDRYLFESLIVSALQGGLNTLAAFCRRQVDLINIKTFLRVKRMRRDRPFLQAVLLPGGFLSGALFSALFDEPLEALISRLQMSDYAPVVAEGVHYWQEKGNMSRFEKLADDYLTAFLQIKKRLPFGPEPLIGYQWGKEMEIKNIRLILVGKINRLPAEAIRERLRHVYL